MEGGTSLFQSACQCKTTFLFSFSVALHCQRRGYSVHPLKFRISEPRAVIPACVIERALQSPWSLCYISLEHSSVAVFPGSLDLTLGRCSCPKGWYLLLLSREGRAASGTSPRARACRTVGIRMHFIWVSLWVCTRGTLLFPCCLKLSCSDSQPS